MADAFLRIAVIQKVPCKDIRNHGEYTTGEGKLASLDKLSKRSTSIANLYNAVLQRRSREVLFNYPGYSCAGMAG